MFVNRHYIDSRMLLQFLTLLGCSVIYKAAVVSLSSSGFRVPRFPEPQKNVPFHPAEVDRLGKDHAR